VSTQPVPEYSFKFDKAKDTWVCSVHGEVDSVGYMPCWNGCDEGWFDDYEEDPIECEPGEISMCRECRGQGGWRVCGECAADNPDVEW
jgi:hypothetical protein